MLALPLILIVLTQAPPPVPEPSLRSVAGVAVDRQGQPVVGAIVFQTGDAPARTQTETAAAGRFQLDDAATGRTFVFARKNGYRFAGVLVRPGGEPVKLTLIRQDEPAPPRTTLPPLLPHDEELALARRLLDPYAERALKEGGEPEKVRTLEAMARIEPARVLEVLETKPFADVFLNDMIRLRVASALAGTALDEALAVVESIQAPSARAQGLDLGRRRAP